jgi:hypothetical protein
MAGLRVVAPPPTHLKTAVEAAKAVDPIARTGV